MFERILYYIKKDWLVSVAIIVVVAIIFLTLTIGFSRTCSSMRDVKTDEKSQKLEQEIQEIKTKLAENDGELKAVREGQAEVDRRLEEANAEIEKFKEEIRRQDAEVGRSRKNLSRARSSRINNASPGDNDRDLRELYPDQ
jgi:peptidoglycan hydrolase CwlO-like protein